VYIKQTHLFVPLALGITWPKWKSRSAERLGYDAESRALTDHLKEGLSFAFHPSFIKSPSNQTTFVPLIRLLGIFCAQTYVRPHIQRPSTFRPFIVCGRNKQINPRFEFGFGDTHSREGIRVRSSRSDLGPKSTVCVAFEDGQIDWMSKRFGQV
jgi:hypothetical protein